MTAVSQFALGRRRESHRGDRALTHQAHVSSPESPASEQSMKAPDRPHVLSGSEIITIEMSLSTDSGRKWLWLAAGL